MTVVGVSGTAASTVEASKVRTGKHLAGSPASAAPIVGTSASAVAAPVSIQTVPLMRQPLNFSSVECTRHYCDVLSLYTSTEMNQKANH
uniref:Uncharacterized protein n=1 Tax=Rhipicephalus zambeziensis TaxID=60191 RepID=A0A224Y6U2_9ACAR